MDRRERTMHILILAPFLWSGAGAAITRLAIEFSKRGACCDVVSSGKSRGLKDWKKYILQLKRAGIGYKEIDLFDREMSSVWNSAEEIRKLLNEKSYDLIHVHSGIPAMVASIARDNWGRSIPIIATFHSWNPDRPQWMNWSDIWALNRCDRIVADSESYLEYLIEKGINRYKSQVIHLGIDIPRTIQKKRRNASEKAPKVLSVGRIERRKDQETLIRAFAIFRREIKGAVLDLVGPTGEKEYERNLRRRCKAYGWGKNVRFRGMVDNIEKFYRQADLYISTSRDEGFGLALLESMAYGLPSLSTAIPGHLDFARNGINTWEIPIGDYRTIACKMLELYRNSEARESIGRNAKALADSHFAWNNSIEKYAKLYNEVVD
jgi:glycosyltransferase involved in cell wall biosynthesis